MRTAETPDAARALARQAVHIAEETDFLTMKADARMALAEVLALYRLKGNTAGAAAAGAALGQGGSVGALAGLDGGDEPV